MCSRTNIFVSLIKFLGDNQISPLLFHFTVAWCNKLIFALEIREVRELKTFLSFLSVFWQNTYIVKLSLYIANTGSCCILQFYAIQWSELAIFIYNFVTIFFQTILSFVLSRKNISIYNDITQKYGNVTVKDFRKYEKLE